MVVWFDAFTQNVDRTPRNANLLLWHRKLYPIDHGAALYFHHDWPTMEKKIDVALCRDRAPHPAALGRRRFPQAAAMAHQKLTPEVLGRNCRQVPDVWLESIPAG